MILKLFVCSHSDYQWLCHHQHQAVSTINAGIMGLRRVSGYVEPEARLDTEYPIIRVIRLPEFLLAHCGESQVVSRYTVSSWYSALQLCT